jgi:succinoglycan biosynthesis transport protein ExoP
MAEEEKNLDLLSNLRLFLGILEKRKWFAFGIILIAVTLSVLFTMRQVPVYRATATIIIERRTPTVLSRVQEVMELGSTDYWSMKEYMQTQYEILKSRRLLKRVVDRLALGLDAHFLGLDRVKPPLADQALRRRMEQMDPVAMLADRVKVEPKADSQFVLVSVEHSDPRMAQEIVNTLVEEFKDENLEYKKRVVSEAITELRAMTVRLRQEKESAETAVLDFERRHSMSSLASRKRQVEQKLEMLGQQNLTAAISLADAQASRTGKELEERVEELSALLATDDLASASHPVLVESGNITSLKLRLVDLDTKVRETAARYGPKHPVMQAAYGQRGLVRKALKVEARVLLESEHKKLKENLTTERNRLAKAQEMAETLTAQLGAARVEEAELAKLETDYVPLKKRMDEARAVYEDVKGRYSETLLSSQVDTNNIRVQDYASMPKKPVRPNRKVNILLGILLGVALGVGGAYFVESLDSTLKTREDVEAIGRLEFLGLVPLVDDVVLPESGVPHDCPELFVHHMPKASISEHFRTIRTNLFFSGGRGRIKRMLVTSPGPKEGKTTVGSNLAAVAALSGTRTVVVDTDMRRPRVHKLFGIPRRPGITEYFMGTAPITKYTQRTPVENLDVLTCGSLSPNPLELLESPRFGEMVDELGKEYDLIMFDSPPLLAVADAKIVCGLVDVLVLVVRAGQTTKEGLREARQMLYPLIDENVGVVLNGFDVEKHSYRYYYYRSKTYAYYNYYSYDDKGQEPEVQDVTTQSRSS